MSARHYVIMMLRTFTDEASTYRLTARDIGLLDVELTPVGLLGFVLFTSRYGNEDVHQRMHDFMRSELPRRVWEKQR